MKTTQILKTGLIAFTALGLTLTSCKKEKDESTSAAENYSTSENANNDLDAIADQAETPGIGGKSLKVDDLGGILSDSVVITKTQSNDTTKYSLNFGTGYVCKDGKTRKGKVYLIRKGEPFITGTVRTITTENYYVNGNKVEGTRTATLLQTLPSAPTWRIVGDITVTLTNGEVVSGSTDRTRVFSAGYLTLPDFSDDEFTYTGTAAKTKASGEEIDAKITTALVYKVSCHEFVSGVLEITPSGKETRVIDFGSGTCDETVTVSVGKYSKTYTSKK